MSEDVVRRGFQRWLIPLLVLVLTGLAPMYVRFMEPERAASAEPERTASAEHDEEAPAQNIRFFKDVQDTGFPGPYHALSRLSYNGDFVLLVETDAERTPVSDTLLVWIQHHGPAQPISKQAEWADLIISCYPELLPEPALQRHVLSEARGKVWLYFVEDDYLIVTDQRQPALDFALKRL